VQEKDFINKVHRKLPKEVYRWKINDPYHGGVSDTYYSGPNNHCWIEYKYKDNLPAKLNSKIKINLSEQQRIWLARQQEHGVFTYAVFGSGDRVYVTEDFTLTHITVETFIKEAISFKIFIETLTKFCLGETND
tara:strand:- start:87 stop:488 length:402 start_codon:yes stop_codon:yes gene_type:complete